MSSRSPSGWRARGWLDQPASARRSAPGTAWRLWGAVGSGRELVIVSLAHTAVTDDDLTLFRDFPFIQVLDLSHTAVGDNGLVHLAGLPALEELIVIDARFSGPGLQAFQREHASLRVVTEPPPISPG
jgi:hypothetical protein